MQGLAVQLLLVTHPYFHSWAQSWLALSNSSYRNLPPHNPFLCYPPISSLWQQPLKRFSTNQLHVLLASHIQRLRTSNNSHSTIILMSILHCHLCGWQISFMGGRYQWADTSPTSIVVHLWIYTDHAVPVYRTGHKEGRAHCTRRSC
jgi:hypothetical protein